MIFSLSLLQSSIPSEHHSQGSQTANIKFICKVISVIQRSFKKITKIVTVIENESANVHIK